MGTKNTIVAGGKLEHFLSKSTNLNQNQSLRRTLGSIKISSFCHVMFLWKKVKVYGAEDVLLLLKSLKLVHLSFTSIYRGEKLKKQN